MMILLNVIFCININIFTIVNSYIKKNPIIKDSKSNLLDYYISFNNYTAKTFSVNRAIKIYEETDFIKINGKSYRHSPYIFICKDQKNREFLFADNYLYSISNDSNGIKSVSFYRDTTSNCIYSGYIKKQDTPAFPNGESNGPQIYNQYSISDETIILYGIDDKNIIFYFSEFNKTYQISSFEYKINVISCNFLDYTKYLCAFDQNDKIQVITINLTIQDSPNIELKMIKSNKIFDNTYSDKIILYDTDKGSRYKILCSNNKINNKVSCAIININQNNYNINIRNLTDYDIKYSINDDNCYMTSFMSEFLLCCGMANQISCKRKNMSFEEISTSFIKIYLE